jgi:hypothetical protein
MPTNGLCSRSFLSPRRHEQRQADARIKVSCTAAVRPMPSNTSLVRIFTSWQRENPGLVMAKAGVLGPMRDALQILSGFLPSVAGAPLGAGAAEPEPEDEPVVAPGDVFRAAVSLSDMLQMPKPTIATRTSATTNPIIPLLVSARGRPGFIRCGSCGGSIGICIPGSFRPIGQRGLTLNVPQ